MQATLSSEVLTRSGQTVYAAAFTNPAMSHEYTTARAEHCAFVRTEAGQMTSVTYHEHGATCYSLYPFPAPASRHPLYGPVMIRYQITERVTADESQPLSVRAANRRDAQAALERIARATERVAANRRDAQAALERIAFQERIARAAERVTADESQPLSVRAANRRDAQAARTVLLIIKASNPS